MAPQMDEAQDKAARIMDKANNQEEMEQLLKPHVLKKKIIETLEEEAQKQMAASAKMPMSSEEPTGL